MNFKTASGISAALHGGVLLFALITFSGSALDATPPPSMPIDLVSVDEFTKLTKGAKDAKPDLEMPKPKPPVEKKADVPKPVEETKPKVEEKQKPIETAKAEAPPPASAPEPKPDPIAEKLKKQDEPKVVEKKVELPPKKPPQKPQPKFDADKIAALLDKRQEVREASVGAEPQAPSLGSSKGSDNKLSQSEIDAMRQRLRQCWNPPVGAADAPKLFVVFRVILKKDGSIARDPTLVEGTASQFGPALGESAKRALLQCQPYTMLKPEHYEMWKDMEITFDPREMFGG
jgi:colicin import membrane protein